MTDVCALRFIVGVQIFINKLIHCLTYALNSVFYVLVNTAGLDLKNVTQRYSRDILCNIDIIGYLMCLNTWLKPNERDFKKNMTKLNCK